MKSNRCAEINNYHHLLYFWVVAREGSIARACEALHISQPTISNQLRKLERAVGSKVFERAGRGLRLTDTGRPLHGYVEEIFSLGRELQDAVRGRVTGQRQPSIRDQIADMRVPVHDSFHGIASGLDHHQSRSG